MGATLGVGGIRRGLPAVLQPSDIPDDLGNLIRPHDSDRRHVVERPVVTPRAPEDRLADGVIGECRPQVEAIQQRRSALKAGSGRPVTSLAGALEKIGARRVAGRDRAWIEPRLAAAGLGARPAAADGEGQETDVNSAQAEEEHSGCRHGGRWSAHEWVEREQLRDTGGLEESRTGCRVEHRDRPDRADERPGQLG